MCSSWKQTWTHTLNYFLFEIWTYTLKIGPKTPHSAHARYTSAPQQTPPEVQSSIKKKSVDERSRQYYTHFTQQEEGNLRSSTQQVVVSSHCERCGRNNPVQTWDSSLAENGEMVSRMLIFLTSIESHSLRRMGTPGRGPRCRINPVWSDHSVEW